MALDEGNGLEPMNAGLPDFRERLVKATGRTLGVPTLAQRLENYGGSVVFSNVSPGAGIFQDPDGFGWMCHRDVAYGLGRIYSPPLGVSHDAAGDSEMTRRFIDEILTEKRAALAVLWQCEPDLTQHDYPLGSPQHLSAVAAADANVGRVVNALSDGDSENLVIIASDHGHETVREIVPIESILIKAGFKVCVDSRDVVVVSNGLSASIYVSKGARDRVPGMIELLNQDHRIDKVISGCDLKNVGHREKSALVIMVSGVHTNECNEFGVPGTSSAFATALSSDSLVGCGEHGGLGAFEQNPILLVAGEGFESGSQSNEKTSVIDIAPTIARHLRIGLEGMTGRAVQTNRNNLL